MPKRSTNRRGELGRREDVTAPTTPAGTRNQEPETALRRRGNPRVRPEPTRQLRHYTYREQMPRLFTIEDRRSGKFVAVTSNPTMARAIAHALNNVATDISRLSPNA